MRRRSARFVVAAVVAGLGARDAAASVTMTSGPFTDCFTGGASFPGPGYNAPDILSPAPGDQTSSSCYVLTVEQGAYAYLDPTDPALVGTRTVLVRQTNVPNPVGTVVFTTGVYGQSLYSRAGLDRRSTVLRMHNAGYQTFELNWDGPHGFVTNGEGAGWAELAGGYAEVVEYLLAQRVADPNAPLCATGNSAGGSQIAYSISAHGAEGLFTNVVFSGGPPIVDHVDACFLPSYHPGFYPTSGGMGPAHPGRELVDAAMGWSGASSCVSGTAPPAAELNRARRDSLLSSGPQADLGRDLEWTGVMVDFVWGGRDITGATVHGEAFEAALARSGTRTNRVWFTSGIEALVHEIDDTTLGASRIQALLLAHCL